MNRPIKFRFWNREDKCWVHPSEIEFSSELDNAGIPFHLYGKTIDYQQFTGLLDKNGREIYEGDILQAWENNESLKTLGVCKQVLGGWKIFSYPDPSICWHGWKQEIIGNVYENPELVQ